MRSFVWDEALSHYRELLGAEEWLEVSMCWTVIIPTGGEISDDELIQGLSGGRRVELRFGGIGEFDLEDETVVSFDRTGSMVTLFEGIGTQGRKPNVLRRISRNARVCGVGWDIDGNSRLNYFAEGAILASVDAAEPEDIHGDDQAVLQPELRLLSEVIASSDGDDWQAGALAVVEKVTGLRLTSQWLSGRYPCVLMPMAGG
ncbi:DUF6461 domain-containing protein [Streptosporangium sp. NPDC002524]|uniref:DUF6461 domain-containing protein n=1 Tax=Streptosporangium sp. NPDC002524 TaxID=3154537 RepID=UPI00332666BF